ncbi:hypothetical protein [Colwellia sp. Bg11-12]|uniref:hypothetical protein n=1 Tax=Colwellia sp. Bg11-12 TaxID=2759817 RepID=UPI0015F49DCD|nr:hypothetical protein [Colwellia sp. Bg11-12]MBA6263905.1 hypothetical protein [Colwellia sp. Bg11-12]
MKVYLISFTSAKYPVIERQVILDFLNTQPIIKNWHAVMPNAILVATEHTIKDVSIALSTRFPQNLTVLVTDASYADGLANNTVWDFINKPKSSGRWP